MTNPEIPKNPTTDLFLILQREAERMTGDIETYERFLEQRILVEEGLSEKYRSFNSNNWGFGDGSYRSYSEKSAESGSDLGAPLSGLEKLWAQRIDGSLIKKQGTGSPVTVVDFGGGFGLSLLRISAEERYREAVERGDLILVVTNLGYLPSEEPDEEGYTLIAKSVNARNKSGNNLFRDTEELRFIQDNQHAVHYLDTNLLELQDTAIQIADGKTMSLKGNVDILSERTALAHTHIPDIGLGTFAELLGRDGTLFLSTKKANFLEPPQFLEVEAGSGQTINMKDEEYAAQRRIAFGVGIAAMTDQLGMELAEDDPLGSAIFFKR
jgi:hypothetical protein